MNQLQLINNICSFTDAKIFAKYQIPQLIYIGSAIYNEFGEPYIITQINNEDIKAFSLSENKIDNFNYQSIYKAYNASELGMMVPTDYISPINTTRGWAWVGNDGNIILKNSFYRTEAEARSQFLLYFLEITIIDVDDIKSTLEKNLKLLS